MTDELKLCPCCGGASRVKYTNGNPKGWTSNVFYRSEKGFVECVKCGLRTKEYSRVCRAIEAWHRRTI